MIIIIQVTYNFLNTYKEEKLISVSSALEQEKIKDFLENLEEGDYSYKFVEKKGIKLLFEVTCKTGELDKKLAARNARELLKVTPWGKVLYFNAAAE